MISANCYPGHSSHISPIAFILLSDIITLVQPPPPKTKQNLGYYRPHNIAKQGDNALGSILLSVCLSICLCFCFFACLLTLEFGARWSLPVHPLSVSVLRGLHRWSQQQGRSTFNSFLFSLERKECDSVPKCMVNSSRPVGLEEQNINFIRLESSQSLPDGRG